MSVVVLATCGSTFTSDGLELRLSNEARPPDILIEWHGIDAATGLMTAAVSDGRAYEGPYFKITPDARTDQLAPLWEGWSVSRGWGAWRPESASGFVKTYDGMVLANLSTTRGDRMRCRFQLESPSLGMNGGGSGKCQFLGGKTIDTAFSTGREN
jgi:hypothetical protein